MVRIYEGARRDPRTADLVQFFRGWDPWIADLVQFYKIGGYKAFVTKGMPQSTGAESVPDFERKCRDLQTADLV